MKTTTMFKDVETGQVSTEMPTNRMFEITNVLEYKSCRENRREKRKQQRKNDTRN